LRVNTGDKIVKPRVFSNSADLRQPVAMAIDPRGAAWVVGDPQSNAIFRLSPNGAATIWTVWCAQFRHQGLML
jgi:streptogramin lyase